MAEEAEAQKRPAVVEGNAPDIGPLLPPKKKRKVLQFERLFLDALPSAEMYEKSYMHRDVITHVVVTPLTDFVVTGSVDGHVKFWEKQPVGIEFVKHIRAHLGPITGLAASNDGLTLVSTSKDKTIKLYEVQTFDMVNIFTVPYTPATCEWISHRGTMLAVAEAETAIINIYDITKPIINKETKCIMPLRQITSLHTQPVSIIKFSEQKGIVISADKSGVLEYWSNTDFGFPKAAVKFEYKLDTDLFVFAKNKTVPVSIAFSPKGDMFATMGRDRMIRLFSVATGKQKRVYNESLTVWNQRQKSEAETPYKLEPIDFGRRMAVERELDAKADHMPPSNVIFDDSGNFILYPTLGGIKVLNWRTNVVSKVLGRVESSTRFLNIALFQGRSEGDLAMDTRNRNAEPDPTVFCCAYNKQRFYMFSRREPAEQDGENLIETGRDVFNERPTEAAAGAAVPQLPSSRLARSAVIHTTMGDIHIKLFPQECPKTVENFTVHSRDGYYNGCIFHRVIKGFMIQTGDPQGDGTGGESIWGHDFEDEFNRSLRHDRPFTVSMANAGVNTNGSQFFITTVVLTRLDNKHTVFGRCTKGQEVVLEIEKVKTDKTAKPLQDIKIINIDTSFEEEKETAP
eukprot:TRINITY_DN5107_c0_g1_i1.p1 TRINITY_DN5107_c0_g1~~TRINITY_DN5107_c0_g1_i1.p1  ORF type:complete len:627 (-),score=189.39 TRINITY_DN5107_c0_g1_i1:99-1979(-)